MVTLLIKTFGVPMALTVALVPIAKWLAKTLRVIDKPSGRKIHTNPTPLLGGLAVYAAMVIYEASRGAIAGKVMALVAACGVAVLLGALDDRFEIQSRYRLCFQASLALLLGLADFRTHLLPYGIDLIVSTVWITGMINAMNCFDCADGVCAGVSCVILLCYGVMLTMAGHGSLALISYASAGAACGFLIFNYPPAKIFMGDCGSTALGLLIGAVSLRATADSSSQYVLYAAAPVALPVADILIVHIRRYINGTRNIRDLLASAGKDHLPHRLREIGFTPRQTVFCLCLITALLATVPITVRRASPATAHTALTLAMFAVVFLEWQYIKSMRMPVDVVVVSREDSPSLSVSITSPQANDG
jgi:UDP-GlcNAc:undecaprenyl-phosphate GlcNAc-1-phosphate transferase